MNANKISIGFATGIVGLMIVVQGCTSNNGNVFQGYAEGEFIRIAAPYAGALLELKVQRGVQVNAGTPLFVLEQENEKANRLGAQERLRNAESKLANLKKGKRPTELAAISAQLDQAKAAQTQAGLDFQRDEKLAATGFIAPQKLDATRTALTQGRARVTELEAQLSTARLAARSDEIKAAEADVETARAALQQAEWQLAQKSVNAPAAGLVEDTLYVQGEWVPAGNPVVSLLPPANIKVRFFVPEPHLASLRTGQAVKITCDSCGGPISASISYIAPQAEYTPPVIYSKENRNKLVFLIEARPLPADAVRLHPGQPLEVAL